MNTFQATLHRSLRPVVPPLEVEDSLQRIGPYCQKDGGGDADESHQGEDSAPLSWRQHEREQRRYQQRNQSTPRLGRDEPDRDERKRNQEQPASAPAAVDAEQTDDQEQRGDQARSREVRVPAAAREPALHSCLADGSLGGLQTAGRKADQNGDHRADHEREDDEANVAHVGERRRDDQKSQRREPDVSGLLCGGAWVSRP